MNETTASELQGGKMPSRTGLSAAIVAVVLIGLGDALLFDRPPGISLFIFAMLIGGGILLINRRHLSAAHLPVLALASVLILPLVETLSLQGLLAAFLGLSLLALASQRLLPPRLSAIPRILLRYGLLAPFRLIVDAVLTLQSGLDRQLGKVLARSLIAWIVPAVFAVIFILLFANANPIIDSVVQQFDVDAVLSLLNPARIVVWILMAMVIWPFLRPKLLLWRKRAKPMGISAQDALPARQSWLFGRDAILRSLVVFNAIFAIQTALDLTYLWGGVSLPDGISHADYAHRGAYPLIATALLAAAFVLAAMRKNGPGQESALIRRLVYVWIAQNVLLCISSILRLDLYVEVYSLTEMRVAAGIWMGLVAVGLVLILARIVMRQSNAWLVATNLVALWVVLWSCAWIDFSALISRFNVEHSFEISGQGQPLDQAYLLSLGPSALPALDDFLARAKLSGQTHSDLVWSRRDLVAGGAGCLLDEHWNDCTLADRRIDMSGDWRSWTFRNWRFQQYLATR